MWSLLARAKAPDTLICSFRPDSQHASHAPLPSTAFLAGLASFGRGLDGTPLLLSEAFVSRCCPPLSDLLHLVSASPSSLTSLRSRSGSVSSATGDVASSTPIKKVRPYTISTSTTARIQPTTLPTTLVRTSPPTLHPPSS